jgi:hypothetical protein
MATRSQAKSKAKAKATRSTYTPAHAAAILERLAGGEPLAAICRDIGPHRSVVYDWADAHPDFGEALKRARLDGEEAILADCLTIADDGRRDYVTDEDGREVVDHDHIQRSKLRVWTRLQLLAKWNPTKWGDRVQHANDPENPLPAPQFIIQPTRPAAGADE